MIEPLACVVRGQRIANIKKGQIINRRMLTILRPAKGVAPKYIDVFVGKRAQMDLAVDTPVNWDLITQK